MKNPPPNPAPPPPGPDWTSAAVRVPVGLVLALAGIHKAATPTAEFAAVVSSYYILPENLVPPFAEALPWIEALVGVALAGGYLTRAASAWAAGLYLMFIGALSSTLVRGIPLDSCGCFGGNVHLSPAQGIALDALLLAGALFVWRRPRSPGALDNWVDRGTL